jgi:hypothetical protein
MFVELMCYVSGIVVSVSGFVPPFVCRNDSRVTTSARLYFAESLKVSFLYACYIRLEDLQ